MLEEFVVGKRNLVDSSYWEGWTDCLDVILIILSTGESVDKMKEKVCDVQLLVRTKKIGLVRVELGVIGNSPF